MRCLAGELVDAVTIFLADIESRNLVVIDNLDGKELSKLTMKLIKGSWRQDSKTAMIITSRLKSSELEEIIHPRIHSIDLECFTEAESFQFLRKRTGNHTLNENECKELHNELGGLPLAMDQAAANIKALKYSSLADYIKKIKKRKLTELSKAKAFKAAEDIDETRLAVKTTWGLNMEALKNDKNCPAAFKVAQVLALLSPQGIPDIIINVGDPPIEDEAKVIDCLTEDKADIIFTLTRWSLFSDSSGNLIQVHRLVQEIIVEEMNETKQLPDATVNATRMLAKALSEVHTPDDVLGKTDPSNVNLHMWSQIMDNFGHFLDSHLRRLGLTSYPSNRQSQVKLLGHATLYYTILNQNERAQTYKELRIDLTHELIQQGQALKKVESERVITKADKESLLGLMAEASLSMESKHHNEEVSTNTFVELTDNIKDMVKSESFKDSIFLQ